jgi:hypothetical protein
VPVPTSEQDAAVDAFTSGDHLVLQAGAGTGKTTTLTMLAGSTRRQGRYLSFNRAIADEASAKFPSSVRCQTAHSLAFRAVGRAYAARLNAPRVASWSTGLALGIKMTVRIGEREVSSKALSYTALRTVTRFCQSADFTIQPHRVPRLNGLQAEDLHAPLADVVLP